MVREVVLLALALLMATLRDWFVICQASVPRVCNCHVSRDKIESGCGGHHLQIGRQHPRGDDQVAYDEA